MEARHFEPQNLRWVFPKEESKGKRGPRVVYLTDRALEMTKTLAVRYPHGKLLRASDGQPWERNKVRCRFRRLRKKLGKRFCAYHIRHTWATRALQNGVDPLTVAILMGHVDVTTVSRTYQHLALNQQYLRSALARAVGGAGA